jgi:DNA-binding CsgD family transcriptional regulator
VGRATEDVQYHDQVIPAVQAGAAGYLLKDVDPSGLEAAVRLVHEGEALLDPQIAGRVMEEVAHPPPTGDVASLTPREREVLVLLGRGMSNRQLADTLVVSEKTVKTHVSNILMKLGVHDRTQAALLAVREDSSARARRGRRRGPRLVGTASWTGQVVDQVGLVPGRRDERQRLKYRVRSSAGRGGLDVLLPAPATVVQQWVQRTPSRFHVQHQGLLDPHPAPDQQATSLRRSAAKGREARLPEGPGRGRSQYLWSNFFDALAPRPKRVGAVLFQFRPGSRSGGRTRTTSPSAPAPSRGASAWSCATSRG